MTDVFIVGCGDIGVRVARLLKASGRNVSGLVRSAEGAARLERFGIEPVLGDLEEAQSLRNLPTSKALVFYFAPPPGGGPYDSRMHRFCQSVDKSTAPAKVVYMSTSGVYGDCGGQWVTEETPINPQTSRAQRRADAEKTVLEWGHNCNVPVVILRVTGIYGPGRLPLARLQQGHPVLCEAESPPTNRIHADDLAAVCVAAAEKAKDREIFNVSDGHPGTMTQYFTSVAILLGLEPPKQVSMAEAKQVMNPMMLSYLQETRRMDNRKMREELDVVLRYPNLDAGLKNVIDQLDQENMGYYGSVGH